MVLRIESAIATGHPYLVLLSLEAGGEWAYDGPGGPGRRGQRISAIQPQVDRCLSSEKAFERMAGVIALLRLKESVHLGNELEKDSSFLLATPEPVPNVFPLATPQGRQEAERINRPAEEIGFIRLKLIKYIGEHRVIPSRGNLEAILLDARERKDSMLVDEVRDAISMLDGHK
jgi:hypothetical protein